MTYIEHLRSQAERCLRAALTCQDAGFAAQLTTIALELRQEADGLDAGANRQLRRTAAAA